MKNTAKSQPKQALRQGKSTIQSGKKKQTLLSQPPAQTVPASEEKYRRLFESAQDGILLLDAGTGVISDANPVIEEMLGYPPSELIGKKLWETGPFKNVSASQTVFLKLQKKSYFRYEDLPIETRGGQHRNVDFVSNVYQVGTQKVIQCNIRDITERRQAENALAESTRRYQELFDNAGLGIFQTSVDGRIMAVNSEFARIFGYQSPEEFIALVGNAADVFADPQRRAEIIRLKAEHPQLMRFENLYRRKDGSTFFGSLTLRQVAAQDGQALFEGLVEDISERKQAEELLHEDELLYRNIFEGVQDAIFVETPAGKILDVNQRACEMFGYSRAQFLSKTVFDLVPSEKNIVPFNSQDVSPVPDHPIETVNVRANGEKFPIEISIRLQKQKGETVLFVVGRDITARKQAEKELADVKTTLEAAFEQTPIPMVLVSMPDGVLRIVNTACREYLGIMDEPTPVGQKLADFVPSYQDYDAQGSLTPLAEAPLARALAGERTLNQERRIVTKDGKTRWALVSANPIYNAGGDLIAAHLVFPDISERKQAEDKLMADRNLLNTLINSLPDSIYVKDIDSRIMIDNIAHQSRLGATNLDQAVGKTDFDFFSKELATMYREDEQRVISSGKSLINHVEPYVGTDGIHRWLLTTKVPLRDQQGMVTGIVGNSRDITERMQAEEVLARQSEELRRRNDELARLYRASGSLISGASLSLQELAQSIVTVVQQEFGQANCSLLVISRDSNELHRLAAAGPYTGQVKNKQLTRDGPGLVPQAIRTGATLNVGNVRSRPDYLSNWEAARSELVIPLKIGKNVIGAIDVQSSEPDAFSPDDERLMSIFAERAALVLEHGRLNAQTDAHMQQLLALRTIDMAISSSFDITMTLGVLLDQIIRLLGAHAVDILAFNANTQTFKFSCERGFRTHTLQRMQINFGAGYAWSLVRDRHMIVVPDIRAQADGLQRTPDLSSEQFVTYVGLPLVAKGQVKGVLEIFQREALVLEPEGIAFLEMLAGQAAIAIDNSELFERLQSSNAELGMAYDSTLEGWASALELRDKETEGHTRRVAELSTRLAQTMGVRDEDILQAYRGALLHDIGKMGVPDSIVLKPGPLTEEEWIIMRKHPQYAYDMLSPIAYLRRALDIPYCHHERWDGKGYPRGLKGAQIPMLARIFAVVDVWDAITSDRPYRKAWQKEVAIQYIEEQSGQHFDPEVVKAFLASSFKRE